MKRVHHLARASLIHLEPLDPVVREEQQRKQRDSRGTELIDAHSSINPYGGEYARYPAGGGADLRVRYLDILQAEVAARGGGALSLTPEHVLLSAGSSAAIELICRAFLDPARGDRIGITSPTFPLYSHVARSLGIGIVDAPLQGPSFDEFDLEQMLVAGPQVIFLCSPNNPLGRCLSSRVLRSLLERDSRIVVVDEAYVEFSEQASAVALVHEFPNLIVTRTFSKAWGLAGVRAGAVVADPAIIQTLARVQLPFAFNLAAEGALRRKLADPSLMLEAVAAIKADRRRLAVALAELPIIKKVYPSEANFLLVEVADDDEVYGRLIEHGILVARTGWALPDTLRISVGTEADCDRVISALGR